MNIFRYTIITLLLLSCVSYIYSEVIFEDDFNNQPDWQIQQRKAPLADLAYRGESTIPPKWFFYYVAGSYFNNSGHNSLIIDDSHYRGKVGKGVTFWVEADSRNDGWASDSQLGVNFTGQNDVYIRFYIKYDPNWQWASGKQSLEKVVRFTHYWGASPIKYFQDGNQHPIGQVNIAKDNEEANDAYYYAVRYENVYFPEDATPYHLRSDALYPEGTNYGGTGPNYTDDKDWQLWELHVKMNSEVGVPDGVWEFWVNGKLVESLNDLAYSDVGSQEDPRVLWNMLIIGGNDFNHFAPNDAEAEQWYAMDDLVIATEYIGPTECPNDENITGLGVCYCGGEVVEGDTSNFHKTGFCCSGIWKEEGCSKSITTFDSNNNSYIDTVELISIIKSWKNGEISMTQTFNYLNKWKRKERI